MLFDTHIHLNDNKYDIILKDVLDRAINNNVMYLNIIAWDKLSSLKAIAIKKQYDGYKGLHLFVSVGLHPENILELKDDEKDLLWLEDLLKNEDVIAVGEIGFDLYWDKSYVDLQRKYFKKQIEIAIKYQKPIIVHSRDANQMTFDLIKEYKGMVKGIIHCYPGSFELAKEYQKLGFKIGVGGTLTFKNSHLVDVIRDIDLNMLVSETDGPYLAPHPFRGKLNEPAYIPYIINKIEEVRKEKREDIEEVLFNNALDIFNIRG